MTEPAGDPGTPPTFEQRMERFGEEVGAAGERLGRQPGHSATGSPTTRASGAPAIPPPGSGG